MDSWLKYTLHTRRLEVSVVLPTRQYAFIGKFLSRAYFFFSEETGKKKRNKHQCWNMNTYWICTQCLVLAAVPEDRCVCVRAFLRPFFAVGVMIWYTYLIQALWWRQLNNQSRFSAHRRNAQLKVHEWNAVDDNYLEKMRGKSIYTLFSFEGKNTVEYTLYWEKHCGLGIDNRCDWQGDETVHSGALKWQDFNVTLCSKGDHHWRREITAITWKHCCKVKSYYVLSPTHTAERKRRERAKETFLRHCDQPISDWQILSPRISLGLCRWHNHWGT